MKSLLLRIGVNAVALWVASIVVAGITLAPTGTATQKVVSVLLVALVFGVVNSLVRPVVRLLTLPLYVLTLGLITFVINALMLLLTSWIASQTSLAFRVDGFIAALLGSLVVTLVSWVLNVALPD
ncbi:MAG: phage holin family protein [Actinomycetales bacterium]